MAIWAVGDVHGCLRSLDALLEKIGFSDGDEIWFVGDLVNRGPDSLGVLRRVKNDLGGNLVLGNHDLHLLALSSGNLPRDKKHNLDEVIQAEDSVDIFEWLRNCSLVKYFEGEQVLLVHAGLAPDWTIKDALELSREVESSLRSDNWQEYLFKMYGNLPNLWSDKLKGFDRWRAIINYMTRIRTCSYNGKLDFKYVGNWQQLPEERIPWFMLPHKRGAEVTLVFGHWSGIAGDVGRAEGVVALDRGCVWGGSIAAYNLESREIVMQVLLDDTGISSSRYL